MLFFFKRFMNPAAQREVEKKVKMGDWIYLYIPQGWWRGAVNFRLRRRSQSGECVWMNEWMGEREDCGRSWVETIPPKNEPGTGSHERVWDVKLLNIITVSPIKLWVSVFFFFFLSVHAVVFFFSFPFLSFYCIIIMVWLRQFSTSQGL